MRYIYNHDGRAVFVQDGDYIYDEEGHFLRNVKIVDGDVFTGTDYLGYIALDVFHSSDYFSTN